MLHMVNDASLLHCCTAAGIQGEVVRAVSASRYFSMLASARGEVWAFGGGFNGELGHRSSSWVTSAQKVEGELARVSPAHPPLVCPFHLNRTWLSLFSFQPIFPSCFLHSLGLFDQSSSEQSPQYYLLPLPDLVGRTAMMLLLLLVVMW